MENLIFRRITKDDYKSMQRNIYPSLDVDTVKRICSDFEEQSNEESDWHYFCAEHENEIIGIIVFEQNEREATMTNGSIYSILVAEEARRQKVGTFLVDSLIKFAKSQNMSIIKCTCTKGTVAEEFLTAVNFIKFGELPNAILENDELFNEVYYYYDLLKKEDTILEVKPEENKTEEEKQATKEELVAERVKTLNIEEDDLIKEETDDSETIKNEDVNPTLESKEMEQPKLNSAEPENLKDDKTLDTDNDELNFDDSSSDDKLHDEENDSNLDDGSSDEESVDIDKPDESIDDVDFEDLLNEAIEDVKKDGDNSI